MSPRLPNARNSHVATELSCSQGTTTHENCVYRATGAGACLLYGACPQLLAGEARALSEGAKFRPGNRGQHGGRVSKVAKPQSTPAMTFSRPTTSA